MRTLKPVQKKKRTTSTRVLQKPIVASNDNTRTSLQKGYNEHLAENGIRGAKIMGDWRKKHHVAAAAGDLASAWPFAVLASPFVNTNTFMGATGSVLGNTLDNELGITNYVNSKVGTSLPPGTLGGVLGGAAMIPATDAAFWKFGDAMVNSPERLLRYLSLTAQ